MLKRGISKLFFFREKLESTKDVVCYLEEGKRLIQQKKSEKAIKILKKALAVKPDYLEAYFAIANELKVLEKFNDAVCVYQEIIKLNPDCAEAYLYLGHLFAQSNELEKAELIYQRAAVVKPDFLAAHLHMGVVLAQQGKLHEAISKYLKVLALDSDFELARSALDNLKIIKEKIKKLIINIDTLLINPGSAEFFFVQGNNFAAEGQLCEARINYTKAINLNNNFAEAYFNLASVGYGFGLVINRIFGEHFDFKNSVILNFKKAINIKPDSINIDAQFELAEIIEELSDQQESHKEEVFNEIIDLWRRVTALKPASAEDGLKVSIAHLKLGDALVRKGVIQEGMMVLQKAIKIHRESINSNPLSQLNIRFMLSNKRTMCGPWLTTIGHVAMHLDLYVKMGLLGWRPQYQTILLASSYPDKIVNPCFLNYWSPYINIISDEPTIQSLMPLAKQLELLEYDFCYVTAPDGRTDKQSEHLWTIEKPYALWIVQKQWEAENRPPLLTLSSSDRERGWRCLEKIGIPKDAWFVCLHIRGSGYKGDCSNNRNADPDTYLSAIQVIVEQGGWVIRMGEPSTKPLPEMERVVDYAHSEFKSDWMDVFLCAQCRFGLVTNSGLYLVHTVFGIPCVMTNAFPIAVRGFSKHDIFIPKLYYSQIEKRYLTFAEALSPRFSDHNHDGKRLEPQGVEAVDNTEKEIADAVIEMLDCLEGKVQYTQKDNALQDRFNTLVTQALCYETPNSRMGRSFLEKYSWLLDDAENKNDRLF